MYCAQPRTRIQIDIERLAQELGTDHALFREDFQRLLQTVCTFALRLQQEQNNSELALLVLLWAEDATDPARGREAQPEARSLVYNNLGCVYRRAGKL